MTAKQPQVVHGKQPAAQPQVVTGGPLGEQVIRPGAHQPPPAPEGPPVEQVEPAPAEPVEPAPDEPEEPQGE